MKVLFFNVQAEEVSYLESANKTHLVLEFISEPLTLKNSIKAKGFEYLSITASDRLTKPLIEQLHIEGVRFVAIREAAYDKIDIPEAASLGLRIANVPGFVRQQNATPEEYKNMAETTFYNLLEWQSGLRPDNELTSEIHFISAAGNKK